MKDLSRQQLADAARAVDDAVDMFVAGHLRQPDLNNTGDVDETLFLAAREYEEQYSWLCTNAAKETLLNLIYGWTDSREDVEA
jgi:hypothetical protein